MKTILMLISCLSFFSFIQAQTLKGNLLVGGDFDMDVVWDDSDNSAFSLKINATSAYLVTDNFAVGGGIGYALSIFDQANVTATNVTIYPLFRYYFDAELPIRFFLDIRPGVFISTVNSNFGDDSQAYFIFRGGPGMAVFLSDAVSVDFSLNYYKDAQNAEENINRIGLNVGFQIFLTQSGK